MEKPEHVWMVRAGNNNTLAPLLWNRGSVAIGWHKLGDLSKLTTREAVKRQYKKAYPDDSTSMTRVAVNAGQIYRFAHEMTTNDYVVSYIQATREIIVGEVDSAYIYDLDVFSKQYPNVRHVTWLNRFSRDELSEKAQNSTGSTLTVFNLDNYIDEFSAMHMISDFNHITIVQRYF
jgi:restriction system protein